MSRPRELFELKGAVYVPYGGELGDTTPIADNTAKLSREIENLSFAFAGGLAAKISKARYEEGGRGRFGNERFLNGPFFEWEEYEGTIEYKQRIYFQDKTREGESGIDVSYYHAVIREKDPAKERKLAELRAFIVATQTRQILLKWNDPAGPLYNDFLPHPVPNATPDIRQFTSGAQEGSGTFQKVQYVKLNLGEKPSLEYKLEWLNNTQNTLYGRSHIFKYFPIVDQFHEAEAPHRVVKGEHFPKTIEAILSAVPGRFVDLDLGGADARQTRLHLLKSPN